MFGENLTVEGLDEGELVLGSTYRIGEALVRITTPREPCYKLGIRFGDQGIIQKFVERERPGTYVAVLEAGHIKPGDPVQLIETGEHHLSIRDFYHMWYAREKEQGVLALALKVPWLPTSTRQQLLKWQA
jgi:MOSC domain-containing protein YiiM